MVRPQSVLVVLACILWGSPFAQAGDPAPASRITFVSHRSGENLLYVMNPDGTGIRPIFGGPLADVPTVVEGTALCRSPHWTRQSPDHRYFACWAYDRGSPFDRYQGSVRFMLYAGGIDAAWSRVVNPDSHEEFAWSPDSRRLAFSIFSGESHQQGFLRSSLRSTEIAICGFDGSQESFILEQPGILIVMDWSPDGKRLLLERRYLDVSPHRPNDILQFELAEDQASRARSRGNNGPLRGSAWSATTAPQFLKTLIEGTRHRDPNNARYSPDGRFLAIEFTDQDKMYAPNELGENEFERNNMMRYLGKLAVFEIATGRFTAIVDDADGLRGPVTWSPDGNEILFSRYLPKGDDREKMAKDKEHGLAIWSVHKDGRGARFVTTGWSPDWR
jgi:hypothetical protein